MKSLSQFIKESGPLPRISSVEEVKEFIKKFKDEGEILNPVYQELYKHARRIFEQQCRVSIDKILDHKRSTGDKNEEIDNLYYDWPRDTFTSLGKFEKTLKSIKNPDYKPFVNDGHQTLSVWKPIAEDLKTLKGMVVKVTTKRQEAKAEVKKEIEKSKGDSGSLMKVLESHKADYLKRTEELANQFIKSKMEELHKHNWDLNKVAPEPNARTMGSDHYKMAKNRRNVFLSLTSGKSSLRIDEPDIRHPDQNKFHRYVQESVKSAEASFEEFVNKMVTKIGKPVIDAKMTGNIWTDAVLTVTTNDGENQVWNTKMIINFSKYQKVFNQFPTRREK